MTDDHAKAAMSAYPNAVMQTPNLDQLASEGVLFDRAYCTNSICGPSKFSHKNGFKSNHDTFNGDQATLAKYLQSTGYHTSVIGKWHLVSEPQGFDEWKILQGQGEYYNPHIVDKGDTSVIEVADDLGYADLSINGSLQIQTPHIDALAKSGMRFTQGYVSSPVCSPSRAGLLTGINQVSFGHDNNLGGNQPGFDHAFLGLPISQKTTADHLNKAGYVTGLIGKWHLGQEEHFHPLKRGFDEFWGYTGGGHDYFISKP
eukprot:maker-scaffold1472_size39644-snap-gene-0.0 protein:Tk03880 transcript:maker-scaffold1472_size39644-snap-gene-0.0-mRNA-1 annotation:"n-acetylgalactosamine-6-sulfate sulfatase"